MKTKHHLVDDNALREETRKILRDTVGMDIEPTTLVRTLSIAQRQMIEIA